MLNSKPISRNQIAGRRVRFAIVFTIICAILAYVCVEMKANLWRSSFFTGYILIGCIFFLTAFNLRKKFTFLPAIGTAALWMQLHIWIGLSTFLLFGFHISWKLPDGMFEILLASLYMIVACSGLYGLFITRIIPKRLTTIGNEVVYERIPALRVQLAYEARQTALGSLCASEVIAKFYLRHLLPFFEQPRGVGYFIFPSSRRKRQLVNDLNDLQRYLSIEQRSFGHQLSKFVQQKDDLDYHHAMQGRLKLWLFLHIGFTYSLLAVSVVHGLLVHSFIGSGL